MKPIDEIYVTGPRNGNYGFEDGVLRWTRARGYDGASLTDATWNELERETWRFDLNEEELYDSGRLRKMYVDGDTLRIR